MFFFKRNLSLDMVIAGYAVVYRGGGAEYFGMEKQLREAEEIARRKKRGMWRFGNIVTPMEYKKEMKKK